jgi:hypothetical protein
MNKKWMKPNTRKNPKDPKMAARMILILTPPVVEFTVAEVASLTTTEVTEFAEVDKAVL